MEERLVDVRDDREKPAIDLLYRRNRVLFRCVTRAISGLLDLIESLEERSIAVPGDILRLLLLLLLNERETRLLVRLLLFGCLLLRLAILNLVEK